MKVRDWVNNNSALVTILSVVLLMLALYAIWKINFAREEYYIPKNLWFYDLGTNKRFPAPREEIPPIDAPSRTQIGPNKVPAGVRVYVFTCGECKDDEMFEAYLETYTPDAKALRIEQDKKAMQMMNTPPDGTVPGVPDPMMMDPAIMMDIEAGHLVARVSDPTTWFSFQSEDGQKAIQDAYSKCPKGKYPRDCPPPDR